MRTISPSTNTWCNETNYRKLVHLLTYESEMLKNEVKDSEEHKGATFNLLQYLMYCYPSSNT